MKFRGFKWYMAAALAFVMGFPLVEKAQASDSSAIVDASLDLAMSIIGAAGNS